MNKIERIFINWEIGDEKVLSILLTESGTINRMGDGDPDQKDRPLCMGRTEDPLFSELISLIDAEMLDLAGRYTLPDQKGNICNLTISLEGPGLDTGFKFTYGDASMGPPDEIIQLVDAAIDLSDPWYEEKLSRRNKKR